MKFQKFQEGGQMGDPMQQLIQAAAQAVQSQDCQTALQVCQALVEAASGGGGGGQQAPEEAPAEQPVYRKGGKLLRRI
jgi:hypothetical protein